MEFEMYANLHLHCTHSDGPYTPEELAHVAKCEGYGAAAITDHDTVTANPEFAAACKKEGMDCIFGIEFSVEVPEHFHMTAFEFDPEYPPMKAYLAQMSERETQKTHDVFDMAVQNGGISGITWEEVERFNKDITWLCNNHVFNAMKAKGLVVESQYMDWFDKNFRKQRALVPKTIFPLPADKLIDLVHKAGGITVLAHPYRHLHMVDWLLDMGIDGIEVWHPELSQDLRDQALAIGLKNNLYISGGSDHSGLCGGYYNSFSSEEELKKNRLYIEPRSAGTTFECFKELKTRTKGAWRSRL